MELYFYDSNNALIYTHWLPGRRPGAAHSGLSWSTKMPGGYDVCTFDYPTGHALKDTVPPPNHLRRLIVRDGVRTVFDGQISAPKRIYGSESKWSFSATGWYGALAYRHINKVWYDVAALSRVYAISDPAQGSTRLAFENEGDNFIRVRMAHSATDEGRDSGDIIKRIYRAGTGYIKSVAATVTYNGGEDKDLTIYNSDQSAAEYQNLALTTGGPTTITVTFTHGNTTSWEVWVNTESDSYDSYDYVALQNAKVKCFYNASHPQYGSEAYKSEEIIKDVLYEIGAIGSTISSDLSGVYDIGTALGSFLINKYTPAIDVIIKLCDLTDSVYNTYYPAVWGGDNVSDRLPQFVVVRRDTSTPDYVVRGGEAGTNIDLEQDFDNIFNYISLIYQDGNNIPALITPVTQSTLKDDASITTYGRREKPLDINFSTSTDVIRCGELYLANHKDPVWRGKISKVGSIRKYGGGNITVPVAWVQAGESVYLEDTRETIFIAQTSYNYASDEITITPDGGRDDMAQFMSFRTREIEEIRQQE